jgi:hypothetical protein
MANKKMTKRDYFAILRAAYPQTKADYAEVIKFIDHEVELLEKKNSADKKPTAQQVANKSTQQAIYEGMISGKSYTITDLIKDIPECADLTNQRVSALVRQMIAEGKVERFEDKRKAYFKKID